MATDVPFHVNAIAGGVGGMAQVLVGHPLDVVKSRMQAGQSLSFTPSALLRGMSAPFISSSLLNLVLFSTTGKMRRIVHPGPGPLSLGEVIAAALMTAPVYVAFVTPVELLKVRLVTSVGGSGPLNVARQVVREFGWRGLWRGYTPTCAMRLWGLPFYFGGNDITKKMLQARHPSEALSMGELMFAGGMAGAFFWGACFPFDTIKTVVQSQGISPVEASRNIWSSLGLRGFYRGLAPCLLRSFPANGVVFVAVDLVTGAFMKKS